MLDLVESLKRKLKVPYQALCMPQIMSYSTLMRRKARRNNNEELVQKPGPKKFGEVDMDKFMEDVKALGHRNKRSAGAGEVRSRWSRLLSRGVINNAIRLCRDELKRQKRAMQRHIQWNVPGLVWAMDDTETSISGITMNIHNVRDMSSRYTFRPAVGAIPKGEDVAENLRMLFKDHGAPLFLKRDNGKNLNNSEVNEVLAEFGVIALNSPKHYPPYNGSIEQCQSEMKAEIELRYAGGSGDFLAMAQLAAHDLNHIRRDILDDQTACARLASGWEHMRKYDMKKRKEVRDQIMALVRQITENFDSEKPADFDTIWRVAVETWLRQHGLITVHVGEKCNPI